jgi:beta-lactamase regulating signal transducer with metallopeptidase domain
MNASLAFEVGTSLCMQVAILVAVCVALQRWFNDAKWSCRLWTMCFVSVICLVCAGLLLPHRRLLAFPDSSNQQWMLAIVTWQERIAIAIVSVWCLGIVVVCVWKAILFWQLSRFLRKGCNEISTSQRIRLEKLVGNDRSFCDDGIKIYTSHATLGPFCWQFHNPTIVLPERLFAEDDITLQNVIVHELEHLRTKHPMQHFLQGVCSTIFWFHPAMWVAARGAEITREYLCDEVAAIRCGTFSAYLRTLAKVAQICGSSSCTEAPRGTLAFGNRKSSLLHRCDRLVALAHNHRQPARWHSAVAVCVFLAAAVIVHQIWLPTNVLASNRSNWSPWPTWTASALHNLLDIRVRDFESFETRVHIHEWMHGD